MRPFAMEMYTQMELNEIAALCKNELRYTIIEQGTFIIQEAVLT